MKTVFSHLSGRSFIISLTLGLIGGLIIYNIYLDRSIIDSDFSQPIYVADYLEIFQTDIPEEIAVELSSEVGMDFEQLKNEIIAIAEVDESIPAVDQLGNEAATPTVINEPEVAIIPTIVINEPIVEIPQFEVDITPPVQPEVENQAVAREGASSAANYMVSASALRLPTKEEGCYREQSQYIRTASASDSQGRLLQEMQVIAFNNPSKTTSIYVHRCIYDLVDRLLADFNSMQTDDAYKLGLWGWRSHQSQINARTKNGCPDIYTASPSSCQVPTALPGRSNHQDGLAIDFYCTQGVVKANNCNGALEWLQCHAADYGFVQLKSETWHWDYYTQISNGYNRLVNDC